MMPAFSRGLLFVLLAVDWVEDPHFGTYLFSGSLSSTLVSSLNLGMGDEAMLSQSDKEHDAVPVLGELHVMPASPCYAQQEVFLPILYYTVDSPFFLMSLRQ